MILSHKNRFIFVKSRKTAGTSVQMNLAKHCGPNDLVSWMFGYREGIDGKPFPNPNPNPNTDWEKVPSHALPEDIEKQFPTEWDSYFKFTIVRNPWDFAVSMYWWGEYQRNKPRPFDLVLNELIRELKLQQKFFIRDEKPTVDFFLRFENLQEDYNELCSFLKIEPEKLPKAKTKPRRSPKPYQEYYTSHSKKLVSIHCSKIIDFFGYKF